jgi:OOP family OmpA-OmpF porin
MYSPMQLRRMILLFSTLVFGSLLFGLEASADNSAGGEYLKTGALVYVIQGSTGSFDNTLLYLDGKNVEKLTANTYLGMAVTPGLHEISSAGSTRVGVSLNAQTGNTYYFRLSISPSGLPQLAALSEMEGQQLIAQTRPVRDQIFVSNTTLLATANASTGANTDLQTSSPNQKSSKLYVGIGAGPTKAVGFSSVLDTSVAIVQDYMDTVYGLGLTATGSASDSSSGLKFFVGYNFNKYMALEVFYTDLGEFKTTASFTGGVNSVSLVESYKTSGFGVAGLGMWPINNSFSLFGKLGIISWNMKYQATFSDTVITISDTVSASASSVSPLFGIGAQFDFLERFGIRVEYERYFSIGDSNTSGDKFDIDLISVSGIVRF